MSLLTTQEMPEFSLPTEHLGVPGHPHRFWSHFHTGKWLQNGASSYHPDPRTTGDRPAAITCRRAFSCFIFPSAFWLSRSLSSSSSCSSDLPANRRCPPPPPWRTSSRRRCRTSFSRAMSRAAACASCNSASKRGSAWRALEPFMCDPCSPLVTAACLRRVWSWSQRSRNVAADSSCSAASAARRCATSPVRRARCWSEAGPFAPSASARATWRLASRRASLMLLACSIRSRSSASRQRSRSSVAALIARLKRARSTSRSSWRLLALPSNAASVVSCRAAASCRSTRSFSRRKCAISFACCSVVAS
mmetsp:Transcript_23883/g.56981  ORF Transcript_23883/g.56981 Transcript_23883/m.56981 type:complete len:306 (+) Transcript_23883:22-939(+)